MPDYKHGKIYEIRCNKTGRVYVGSTIQCLKDREASHISRRKVKRYCSWSIIQENDYTMKSIESYPCKSRIELLKRETVWYKKYKEEYGDLCVNKIKPYESKEERNQYENQWRKKNVIKCREAVNRCAAKPESKLKKKEYDAKKGKEKISCHLCNAVLTKKSICRHRTSCFAKTCDSMNHINIF